MCKLGETLRNNIDLEKSFEDVFDNKVFECFADMVKATSDFYVALIRRIEEQVKSGRSYVTLKLPDYVNGTMYSHTYHLWREFAEWCELNGLKPEVYIDISSGGTHRIRVIPA